jgi:hypothetical protein
MSAECRKRKSTSAFRIKFVKRGFYCSRSKNRVARGFGGAVPSRIRGLEAWQFDHLFVLPDAELAEHGAVRQNRRSSRSIAMSAKRQKETRRQLKV